MHAHVYNTDFFPDIAVKFTVYTDDGILLECHRAQDAGKAIHTRDNTQLGVYFRERLGLESGAFVKREHLDAYGRTDVTFYKLNDEMYFMDFRS